MSPHARLSNGDQLPDSDGVSRYCSPNSYDRCRGEPKVGAFQLRASEKKKSIPDLSVNRIQHYQVQSVEKAVECISQEFLADEYGLSKNGGFIVFNVGHAKAAGLQSGNYKLVFRFSPTPPYYSHSSIHNVPVDPIEERVFATGMKRLLRISHTFEGLLS